MLKKRRTILWLGLLLLILIVGGYGWYLYQKPHTSAGGERAAVTVDADSLFYQYQADEHAADLKYMGKVLSVTGKLSDPVDPARRWRNQLPAVPRHPYRPRTEERRCGHRKRPLYGFFDGRQSFRLRPR
jgi:hypothetical protein